MEIHLCKAKKEEKETLYRLLQYSLFEESATDLNEMNDTGILEYKWFENYFKDDDRDAFIVKETGTEKILGFVMINEYVQKVDNGHSIAEFMVIPKYRRNGIVKKVAFECFNMYKGNWEVSPSYGNEKAYLFWKSVIDEYTDNKNEFIDRIFVFKAEEKG